MLSSNGSPGGERLRGDINITMITPGASCRDAATVIFITG